MNRPLEINFEPGCFDSFEGTQEELDSLIADIVTQLSASVPEEIQSVNFVGLTYVQKEDSADEIDDEDFVDFATANGPRILH